MNLKFYTAVLLTALFPAVRGGPLAYAACQTGCNAVAVACYAGAGFVFGATAGLGAPPAIIACNVALGTCMATCATIGLFAPTP